MPEVTTRTKNTWYVFWYFPFCIGDLFHYRKPL